MPFLSLCEGNEGLRAARDTQHTADEKVSSISMTQSMTVTHAALCGNMGYGRRQLMHGVVRAPCLQMENGELC